MKGRNMQLDALDVSEMASGHLHLDLSREVDWGHFPKFVRRLMAFCRGVIVDREGEVGYMRVWRVSVDGAEMWLAWEEQEWTEQGHVVSLAAMDSQGDRIIGELYERLRAL